MRGRRTTTAEHLQASAGQNHAWEKWKTLGFSHFPWKAFSLNEKAFGIETQKKDPEQEAKEENMRKLMSFRKDELILPEDSNDEDSDEVAFVDKREKNI